jgi:hypothetical protein
VASLLAVELFFVVGIPLQQVPASLQRTEAGSVPQHITGLPAQRDARLVGRSSTRTWLGLVKVLSNERLSVLAFGGNL